MPGLSLTLAQAVRLFGVSAQTCRAILEDLAGLGVLGLAHDGQYIWAAGR